MTNLDALKHALREQAAAASSSPKQPLSDTQYSAGFYTLVQGSGGATYRDFIVPQLSRLLDPLFALRDDVSVLEIGPGPESVLGSLPSGLRRKIKKYTAFEPNNLYADRLAQWLGNLVSEAEVPFPSLGSSPKIRNVPFTVDGSLGVDDKFDVVLFCHSMYGMKPKGEHIVCALDLLVVQPDDGMVVVFHRDGVRSRRPQLRARLACRCRGGLQGGRHRPKGNGIRSDRPLGSPSERRSWSVAPGRHRTPHQTLRSHLRRRRRRRGGQR